MEHSAHQQHNHNACIETALNRAVELCKQKNVRLTAIRKQVLKLIWQSQKPIGAYELLPQLGEAGFNSAPPTVYRALEFLLEMQLIHRIHSLNAFIGCNHPHTNHGNCVFICTSCGVAQEISSEPLMQMRLNVEEELGVAIKENVAEFSGLCPTCQTS